MPRPQTLRIPANAQILVTGANGYIASQVADLLLEEGYRVRGSVRSAKPWLNEYFDSKYGAGRFETVIIKDLHDEDAFREAVRGEIAGIVHVATDVSFSSDPNVVVTNSVAGTVNVLKAAAKEPSVKSIVLTSSSTAASLPELKKKGVVLDENTWNDAAVEAAYSKDTPAQILPLAVYAASKTQGERAFWKWVADNKPAFAANALLPNLNLGEILHPEIGGSTMGWTRSLLEGDTSRTIDAFPSQYYVDVRDTARLHVAALLDPQIQSQRLFGYTAVFNWTEILGVLKKLRPDNTKIPQAPENEGRDLTDASAVSKKAESVIQSFFGVPGWTGLEESLKAGIVGH